jgi:hypothetical protein
MLIFLDIDGVMVPVKSWKNPILLSDGFPEFNEKAAMVLGNIIGNNSKLILTTSHKSRYSVLEWKNVFEKRGIIVNNIDKLDESPFYTSRKDELINWFKTHSVDEEYIIIDDDKSLNDLPSYMKKNLILCSSMIGLTEDHLKEINLVLSQTTSKT